MPDVPDLPAWLAGADPAEILTFVRTAGDPELRAALRGVGTTVAVDLLIAAMADRFDARSGRGGGRLALALDADGEQHLRILEIDQAGARVVPPTGRPRATMRISLLAFLRVASGAADPKWLFLTGRLRLSGDAVWAVTTLTGLSVR